MRLSAPVAAALCILCLMTSCKKASKTERLQTGDLVFVGIPMDYSLEDGTMDEAISTSTGSPDDLNLIHVAIAEVSGDSTWIIDATIRHGVDRHPLDTFFTDFTLKDGSLPTFLVKRLKDPSNAVQFVENAKGFVGKAYDLYFLPDNDLLYCSELVRDSYREEDGSYVFDSVPMNFKGPDGDFPLYWKQLFALLDRPIPQDQPGTNPQDMSRSAVLETVNVDITNK